MTFFPVCFDEDSMRRAVMEALARLGLGRELLNDVELPDICNWHGLAPAEAAGSIRFLKNWLPTSE